MVTVKYYGVLVQKTATQEQQFEVKSVKGLLKELKKTYGTEVYTHAKMSHIMVNQENAGGLQGYSTKLHDGDIVRLLPVCGGG